MPVSQDEFRRALSCFASGVNVVTTIDAAGELHGLTVSAFCSVSLSPPLILICIEKATASHFAFRESGAFVVNILNEAQANLSEHFATPFMDKFANVPYRLGLAGIPVLENTIANLECRIRRDFDGGDHSIFVGEVEHASIQDGLPLIYFQGGYRNI
ncbi:MAG: flavin reductase family protein [Pyrinomonadaceae bacterium]